MQKIQLSNLLSLERYAVERDAFRKRVIEHKKHRKIQIGPHVTLIFEDALTIQYQIQEMLRAERIFEAKEIHGELDAYNPLVPDGCNLKATMMIEIPDPEERRVQLCELTGIEDKVWMRVAGKARSYAIADEDLERGNSIKTSAVHFLRFEFPAEITKFFKEDAPIQAGIDHEKYRFSLQVPQSTCRVLARDFD